MVANRRIAVIAYLDIVGYTRLIQKAESAMLAEVVAMTNELVIPTLPSFGGELFKTLGDACLIEFRSAVDAVKWAMAYQEAMAVREFPRIREPVRVRTAIALADVIVGDGDRYGMGMNFVARLQRVSPPGGIVIPFMVRGHLTRQMMAAFRDAGSVRLKDIDEPVPIWTWVPAGIPDEPDAHAADGRLAALIGEPARGAGAPQKPGVAILPFANLSGDPVHNGLATGMTEDITAALARMRHLFTVDARSVATAVGRDMDMRDIARMLGVRYVIEGSVRVAGRAVRASMQIVEAATRTLIWSDRCDGTLDDVFAMQDRVASHTAAALHTAMRSAEIERLRRQDFDRLSPNDLVLRALPSFWTFRREENSLAIENLTAALTIEPDHPAALALKSWCLGQQIAHHWSADIVRDREQALALASRALEMTRDDALVMTAVASTFSLLSVDQARARAAADRATALDPHMPWAWAAAGLIAAQDGRPADGKAALDRAIDLAPDDPVHFFARIGLSLCHFVEGDYATAKQIAAAAMEIRPGVPWAFRMLASAAAMAGDLPTARQALKELLKAYPALTIEDVQASIYGMPGPILEAFTEGLRRAGLPESSNGDRVVNLGQFRRRE